jgi:hypothetical protein
VNDEKTWLPNLVGGVSIWKLARDLNEPKFFDGRLLVPETEGPDTLPSRVTWHVQGLVPLPEARAKNPEETAAAVRDFLARLEGVGAAFASESSGYHKYREAFTLPGLEVDGGAHYFYDPEKKRLSVINWGASPRDIAGRQGCVFGYTSFADVIHRRVGGFSSPSGIAGGTVPVDLPAAGVGVAIGADARKDSTGATWWQRLVLPLAALAALVLVVWLVRGCGDSPAATSDGGVRGTSRSTLYSHAGWVVDEPWDDAGVAVSVASDAGIDDASGFVELDAPNDAVVGAHVDGGPVDARGSIATGAGSGSASGHGSSGGPAAGSASGHVDAGPPAEDEGNLPRRIHFEPAATHWRVVEGSEQLDPRFPLKGDGDTFAVVLRRGGSFDRVRVEWQDHAGEWHR